jgi:hypothetical protein
MLPLPGGSANIPQILHVLHGTLDGTFAYFASIDRELAPRRYSVDQCLYVAMAYCGSYSQTRGGKTRDALTAMGISMNAGSFGMLNVGIALFSCVMPVFRSARPPARSRLSARCALACWPA